MEEEGEGELRRKEKEDLEEGTGKEEYGKRGRKVKTGEIDGKEAKNEEEEGKREETERGKGGEGNRGEEEKKRDKRKQRKENR